MNSAVKMSIRALAAASLIVVASCGKSSDENRSDGDAAKPVVAGQTAAVSPSDAPLASVLREAGFKPIYYRPFPSPVPGVESDMLVYRADRGSGGGVLYLQGGADDPHSVWHWYFEKDAPDSVHAVEVNEDGLWDVRMYMGGEGRDYVQDQSFSLSARQRGDLIAMNGAASEPVDADGMAWRAFDGDTTSAWRSKLDGAFIELAAPLGTGTTLAIQLLAQDQPRKVEVLADGKKVQEFELEKTTLEQDVQLNAAAQGARVLRLEFKSAQSDAKNVAVAELGIR